MRAADKQSALSAVPIARILLPMAVGIIASTACDNIYVPAAIIAAGITMYVVLRLLSRTPSWSARVRPWWIVSISLLSMAMGWGNAVVNTPPKVDVRQLYGSWAHARVNDVKYSDFSMSIHATMYQAINQQHKNLVSEAHNIIITTRGCDYTLTPGDIVGFVCSLDTIRSLGNPDGFDYQSYMIDQGVRYTQHVNKRALVKCGHRPTIVTRCNENRRKLEQKVFASGTSPAAQNFVVATLLGNSHFITPEAQALFSAAGISHILALSGLHVGIIIAMVWFVLFPLDYLRMRRVRLLITIAVMALYATFTGLSPSVVRATIMMVVVITGMIFYRKATSLNTLATAALIILVITPSALWSVGFQLSFTAVAAFLLFFKRSKVHDTSSKKKKKVWSYLTSLIASSVVALLSTLMLTAYYFSSFSLTSIVGNIVILPIFPLVMACEAVYLVLCSASLYLSVLEHMIDLLYTAIEQVAYFSGKIMPGHIDGIYVTGIDVIIYYIALSLALVWYRTRRLKWLNWAMAIVVVIIAHSALVRATVERRGIVVFNNYKHTQIFSFDGNKGRLWVPNGTAHAETFEQYNKKFLAHYGIVEIDTVSGVECDIVHGMSIVCATGGNWDKVPSQAHKIDTDLLVITKNYHGTVERLLSVYRPKQLVLSGDIYDENILEIEQECDSLGVSHHNIKRQGAWCMMQ